MCKSPNMSMHRKPVLLACLEAVLAQDGAAMEVCCFELDCGLQCESR